MKRGDRNRTQSSRPYRSDENNIRELRPEDFQTRRPERDYSLRSLNSSSPEEEPSAPQRASVPDARKRNREAARRRKRSVPAQSSARSAALPRPEESDFTLIASVLLLSFIGLVMVTSSGYYYAYTHLGDSLYFLRKQFKWLLLGLAALLACRIFPLEWVRALSRIIYWLAIACCVLVLFVGQSKNGSTRWLGIGEISFQPAELAKIAVAIHVSLLVEKNQDTIHTWKTFFKLLAVVLLPTVLVTIENLSSGAIIGIIGIVIMFVGGVRWRCFFAVVLPIALLVIVMVVLPIYVPTTSLPDPLRNLMEEYMYRTERIWAWLDPWAYAQDEGYQAIQSLYAVGSGGFFGRGLGNSIQKLGFIPEAHNDIIFSIICEELGLFGAGIVILLFGVLVWHGIKISLGAPDKFTCLLAAGLVGQVGIQAIMNIAVNTNSMPVTGVSLPFISYGGSSMLFLMGSMGLLLNISRYSRRPSAE